jgi:serine protease Do
VESGSTAAKASPIGLRPGDVIQEINREPVRNAAEAVDLSKKVKGKKVISLLVWRDHGSFYVTVDNSKNEGRGGSE